MEQSSTSKIHLPNKELVGVKKSEEKKDTNKIPNPTGWRLLVLPFKMVSKFHKIHTVKKMEFFQKQIRTRRNKYKPIQMNCKKSKKIKFR